MRCCGRRSAARRERSSATPVPHCRRQRCAIASVNGILFCRQYLLAVISFMSPSAGPPATNGLRIRTMRPDEISIAVDWAAAEGWNPGLADAACFAVADPEGFLVGELDGVPAATVSCVNYGASFAFLGFYIVREDLRGRGHGLRIWNAAIAHAGPRVIGLDGVVAQQQNYRKSGFELAYANVRYGGTVAAPGAPPHAGIVALTEVPLAAVEAYDAMVFSEVAPEVSPDRTFEILLEMRHPVACLDQGWSAADL